MNTISGDDKTAEQGANGNTRVKEGGEETVDKIERWFPDIVGEGQGLPKE